MVGRPHPHPSPKTSPNTLSFLLPSPTPTNTKTSRLPPYPPTLPTATTTPQSFSLKTYQKHNPTSADPEILPPEIHCNDHVLRFSDLCVNPNPVVIIFMFDKVLHQLKPLSSTQGDGRPKATQKGTRTIKKNRLCFMCRRVCLCCVCGVSADCSFLFSFSVLCLIHVGRPWAGCVLAK